MTAPNEMPRSVPRRTTSGARGTTGAVATGALPLAGAAPCAAGLAGAGALGLHANARPSVPPPARRTKSRRVGLAAERGAGWPFTASSPLTAALHPQQRMNAQLGAGPLQERRRLGAARLVEAVERPRDVQHQADPAPRIGDGHRHRADAPLALGQADGVALRRDAGELLAQRVELRTALPLDLGQQRFSRLGRQVG